MKFAFEKKTTIKKLDFMIEISTNIVLNNKLSSLQEYNKRSFFLVKYRYDLSSSPYLIFDDYNLSSRSIYDNLYDSFFVEFCTSSFVDKSLSGMGIYRHFLYTNLGFHIDTLVLVKANSMKGSAYGSINVDVIKSFDKYISHQIGEMYEVFGYNIGLSQFFTENLFMDFYYYMYNTILVAINPYLSTCKNYFTAFIEGDINLYELHIKLFDKRTNDLFVSDIGWFERKGLYIIKKLKYITKRGKGQLFVNKLGISTNKYILFKIAIILSELIRDCVVLLRYNYRWYVDYLFYQLKRDKSFVKYFQSTENSVKISIEDLIVIKERYEERINNREISTTLYKRLGLKYMANINLTIVQDTSDIDDLDSRVSYRSFIDFNITALFFIISIYQIYVQIGIIVNVLFIQAINQSLLGYITYDEDELRKAVVLYYSMLAPSRYGAGGNYVHKFRWELRTFVKEGIPVSLSDFLLGLKGFLNVQLLQRMLLNSNYIAELLLKDLRVNYNPYKKIRSIKDKSKYFLKESPFFLFKKISKLIFKHDDNIFFNIKCNDFIRLYKRLKSNELFVDEILGHLINENISEFFLNTFSKDSFFEHDENDFVVNRNIKDEDILVLIRSIPSFYFYLVAFDNNKNTFTTKLSVSHLIVRLKTYVHLRKHTFTAAELSVIGDLIENEKFSQMLLVEYDLLEDFFNLFVIVGFAETLLLKKINWAFDRDKVVQEDDILKKSDEDFYCLLRSYRIKHYNKYVNRKRERHSSFFKIRDLRNMQSERIRYLFKKSKPIASLKKRDMTVSYKYIYSIITYIRMKYVKAVNADFLMTLSDAVYDVNFCSESIILDVLNKIDVLLLEYWKDLFGINKISRVKTSFSIFELNLITSHVQDWYIKYRDKYRDRASFNIKLYLGKEINDLERGLYLDIQQLKLFNYNCLFCVRLRKVLKNKIGLLHLKKLNISKHGKVYEEK